MCYQLDIVGLLNAQLGLWDQSSEEGQDSVPLLEVPSVREVDILVSLQVAASMFGFLPVDERLSVLSLWVRE